MVKNPESLSHLALSPYRVVTDRQTDRQTDGRTDVGRTDRIAIANTRSQQYLPVQLSHVRTAEAYRKAEIGSNIPRGAENGVPSFSSKVQRSGGRRRTV